MTIRSNPRSRRTALLLRASLALALGVCTLSGCAGDSRVTDIEQAVLGAIQAQQPMVIGARVGDLKTALAELEGGSGIVMVPISLPDLATATGKVEIQSAPSANIETASSAAADSAIAAWSDWLAANPDGTRRIEREIPVTMAAAEPGDNSAQVSVESASLAKACAEVARSNGQVVIETAVTSPGWLESVLATSVNDFAAQVTGLSSSDLTKLVELDTARSEGAVGRFKVVVRFPDPSAVAKAQAAAVKESFGTDKIWGEIALADFLRRMGSAEFDQAALNKSATAEATVMLSTSRNLDYDPTETLELGLANHSGSYQADVEPGTSAPPADSEAIRLAAAREVLTQLSAQVIKAQKTPGTKRLKAGGSGARTTITIGKGADRHVTFFSWKSKKPVVSMFVKSGKNITVRVPPGAYRLVYSEGSDWYGPKYSFGPTGTYREFKTTGSSAMKINIRSGIYYRISIAMAVVKGGGVSSGSTSNPYNS